VQTLLSQLLLFILIHFLHQVERWRLLLNLSSCVAYSGAATDVNLGSKGLTSTNTLQGAAIVSAATGTSGGEIYLSQGSTFGTFSRIMVQ